MREGGSGSRGQVHSPHQRVVCPGAQHRMNSRNCTKAFLRRQYTCGGPSHAAIQGDNQGSFEQLEKYALSSQALSDWGPGRGAGNLFIGIYCRLLHGMLN